MPPAGHWPCHSTGTRAFAGAMQNACRWYGDLLRNVRCCPSTSAAQQHVRSRVREPKDGSEGVQCSILFLGLPTHLTQRVLAAAPDPRRPPHPVPAR
jgi:hypothetical protein